MLFLKEIEVYTLEGKPLLGICQHAMNEAVNGTPERLGVKAERVLAYQEVHEDGRPEVDSVRGTVTWVKPVRGFIYHRVYKVVKEGDGYIVVTFDNTVRKEVL